jgi:ATP-dependent Lhr-like helicase
MTSWRHGVAQQLLNRYGVVFRETAHAEGLCGGFSAVYDVLKAMEESGKIRRGYFAADLGATQFALPAAVDLLRSLRAEAGSDVNQDRLEIVQLAATDPANPYGALLRWPVGGDAASSLTRSVGALVVLCNGHLVSYLRRGNPNLQIFLPEDEPQRSAFARSLANFLFDRVQHYEEDAESRGGILIAAINGISAAEHWMARFLLDAGFTPGAMGFNVRRSIPSLPGVRGESRPNA